MGGRDTIEIYEAEGAFERLERWLRERGFFASGGEELVADLYLGYGLSSTIRRQHSSAPPEPCALPFAARARRPGGGRRKGSEKGQRKQIQDCHN